MAAHEEKISDKRRKLFKALSAAPVVLTLRPGSANANSSAFQCAAKILDPRTDPFLVSLGPTPSPTPDFVYGTYDYFKLTNVPSNCRLNELADDFVVYIDGDLYGNLHPGVPITTSGYTYDSGQGGPGSGTGSLTLLDGSGQQCQTIGATSGQFALLDNVEEDGSFEGVAFPKADPAVPNMQGITGTCMASINGVSTQQSLIG